jgi:hypothetical protein
MMMYGNAFGNGIYLSNDLNISYNYGADTICKSGLVAVGVVQILGNKEEFKKRE